MITKNELRNIDVHVGRRIRERRVLSGMSQEALGEATGVTFQQQQKREKASNRVSASALLATAQALDVPVGFFYEDMPVAGGKPAPTQPVNDPLTKRETLELVRAYYKIDMATRKRVFDLIKAMGREGDRIVEAAHGLVAAE